MSEQVKAYQVSRSPTSLSAFKAKSCTKLFIDPEYAPPTPDDIRALRDLLGWSQNDIAKMVGVTFNPTKGSTTVRKWCSPAGSPEHREMPYAAWRLLLIYAGIAEPTWCETKEIANK